MTITAIPAQRQPDEGRLSKLLYRIPEAMATLSLSRTVIYEEMRAGRLRFITRGRARRIPATALEEYVALLEVETSRETR